MAVALMVPLRYNVAETGVTVTPEDATSPQQGLMEASHGVWRDPFSAGVPAVEGRAGEGATFTVRLLLDTPLA